MLILWAVNLWQFGTLVQRDVPMAPSTAVLMSLLALAGLRPAARSQALVSGLLLVAAGTLALLENISPIESGLVPFLTVAPATGLPVFDINTMINWFWRANNPVRYLG